MSKNLRFRQTRSFAVAGLCILSGLALAVLFQTTGINSRLEKTLDELSELERKQRLARHFEERYLAIASKNGMASASASNPRVFWTGLLQTLLVDFPASELTFSIADPVAVPLEIADGTGGPTVTEYFVQLSANLENDAALIGLLSSLQAIKAEFIRNRSCNVNRPEETSLLRLDCVYSILDFTISGVNS